MKEGISDVAEDTRQGGEARNTMKSREARRWEG